MTGDTPQAGRVQPGQDTAGTAGAARMLLLEQWFGPGSLYTLRQAVLAHAAAAGMPEPAATDMTLAVHELVTNAIRHGAGQGQVRMWSQDGALHCQVEDAGQPGGDQHAWPGPSVQDPAGPWTYQENHGLWLTRRVASRMSVVSGPDGTRITVSFELPAIPQLGD